MRPKWAPQGRDGERSRIQIDHAFLTFFESVFHALFALGADRRKLLEELFAQRKFWLENGMSDCALQFDKLLDSLGEPDGDN